MVSDIAGGCLESNVGVPAEYQNASVGELVR